MLSDDEIDKLYEIDDYIVAAEKANVLYLERYDIWQMDRVTLKAFAKLVEERTAAKEREACAKVCEPKAPRPCDCEWCDCGNSTSARMVAEWDESASIASVIRARGEA